jgi:hypothetical protein
MLTRDNLGKRRKGEDVTCLFCCETESVHHLFFDCAVATQLWKILSLILNVNLGGSLDEVGKYWPSNKKHCVTNITSSAAIWSIWKVRNDLSNGHWYDAELANSVSHGAPGSSEGCYCCSEAPSKDVKMVAAPLNTQVWLSEVSLLYQEEDKGGSVQIIPS